MSARAAGSCVALVALLAASALAQTLPSPDTSLPGVRPPVQTLPSPDTSLPGAPPPGGPPPAGTPPGDVRVQPTLGDDKDVVKASEEWLTMLDKGQLGPAWDVSAGSLKKSVTRKEWINGVSGVRKPFGKVVARKAEKFARAHQLPGLPEGDYALLLFDTKFANGKQAEEQLTWTFENDEVWRVAGYFIR